MPFPEAPPILSETLAAKGYDTPTPVQQAVLEPEAHGRDLVVSAQTGSGKTVAFGLAFADQVLGDGGDIRGRGAPSALVIAPTRELALQVSKELSWLYEKTGARIASCVGGMNPQAERRALKAGATIVVGTPGRLRDHIERGALDLSGLAAVVLDEADEMLDMGFREELEYILDATPEGRRVLMFSATMPRPIEALARRYQRDALRIATGGKDRGHGDISYQAVAIPPSATENAVVNLLRFHEAETAILFCATRERVRQLHSALQDRGFGVVALSGEHSQSERNQALQTLRDGRARVCVATDVAARGIDLPTLTLVVHVDLPRDAETLQHRSGRTGRAGRKGTAVMVVPFNQRRRTESMLRHAGIETAWIDVPDRKAVLAQDRSRMLESLMQPIDEATVDGADRELADTLLNERNPREIALMLVQAHRAKMPQPEEFSAQTIDAHRAAQKEKHRAGFEDTVWFRLDVGRRRNADPRWILPILCRRGGITRNEIGAIRIAQNETHFQVPRTVADSFAKNAAQTAGQDEKGGELTIERAPEGPRVQARENGRKKRHQDFHGKASNRHDAKRKRKA